MERLEILSVFRNAARENAKQLSLANNRITEIPPEIGELTQLSQLNLSDNMLNKLPPEIGRVG